MAEVEPNTARNTANVTTGALMMRAMFTLGQMFTGI